jgi:1-acyl-sn-glycerol-3-phosphate acyltransferase
MLRVLPSFILFPLHLSLQMLNLSFWALLILALGLLKLILPLPSITKLINVLLNSMLCTFGTLSVALIKLTNKVDLDYQIEGEVSQQGWYLLMSNHLSWLDIILLTEFAVGRIPAPKFFLKKQLIWLPFVGLAAWALDMPFMRRYSGEFLKNNPHLKGKDIESTRKSCEKFRQLPTTVINFVEGSRYTLEKSGSGLSPFKNLLRPKAGGIAFTLALMGELFSNILDVTILYPDNNGSPMLNMLAGKLSRVVIRVKVLPVDEHVVGDYFNDDTFKNTFQTWLNTLWLDKDKFIEQLQGNK